VGLDAEDLLLLRLELLLGDDPLRLQLRELLKLRCVVRFCRCLEAKKRQILGI
jgi:hypothetical protein